MKPQIPIPDKITIQEKYAPAMEILTQPEADEYFAAMVEHMLRRGVASREKAEDIERANLGYYAGYYGAETRARVERLFKCKHPIFGAIAENGEPTMSQAFTAGAAVAAGVHPEIVADSLKPRRP